MAPKRFRTITVLLFAAHLLVVFAVVYRLGSMDKHGLAISLITLLAVVISEFVLASGVVALLALIPFKKKNYPDKFRIMLLTAVSFLLFCFTVFLAVSFYIGDVTRSEEPFEEIQIPINLDCSAIHDGKFESDKLIIERKGNRQVETNKRWGSEEAYNVEWVSDCEYILTRVDDPETKVRVKVVAVTAEGYSCYAMMEKHSDWNAPFVTFKRIGLR